MTSLNGQFWVLKTKKYTNCKLQYTFGTEEKREGNICESQVLRVEQLISTIDWFFINIYIGDGFCSTSKTV